MTDKKAATEAPTNQATTSPELTKEAKEALTLRDLHDNVLKKMNKLDPDGKLGHMALHVSEYIHDGELEPACRMIAAMVEEFWAGDPSKHKYGDKLLCDALGVVEKHMGQKCIPYIDLLKVRLHPTEPNIELSKKLVALESEVDPGSITLVSLLQMLATHEMEEGQFDEARAHYQQALTAIEARGGPGSTEAITISFMLIQAMWETHAPHDEILAFCNKRLELIDSSSSVVGGDDETDKMAGIMKSSLKLQLKLQKAKALAGVSDYTAAEALFKEVGEGYDAAPPFIAASKPPELLVHQYWFETRKGNTNKAKKILERYKACANSHGLDRELTEAILERHGELYQD